MEERTSKKTVREEFAEKFIALLESDKPLSWTQGWAQRYAPPYNGGSGRAYKGVNRLILSLIAMEKGWTDPRYYTFKQASELGCKVKAGEHACRVEYWMAWDSKEKRSIALQEMEKILKTDPTRKENEFILFAKSAYVFNAAQIDGLQPLPEKEHILQDNELAEEVLKVLQENMGVPVRYKGEHAYYNPTEDTITLPPKGSFFSSDEYYGTALHEFAHATGHHTRLDRPMDSLRSDSDSYCIEELRAEIASTYICAELGVKMSDAVVENHMAYVQGWLDQIKQDHNVLFAAIKDADKITDYIMEKGRVDLMREKLETYALEPKAFDGKTYEIWQLTEADCNRPIAFAGYDVASQYSLTQSRYEKVFEGIAGKDEATLEDIFYKFNISRPNGFTGHSLSVSDVVVLHDGDQKRAFYCDTIGFKEIKGFSREQRQEHTRRRTA